MKKFEYKIEERAKGGFTYQSEESFLNLEGKLFGWELVSVAYSYKHGLSECKNYYFKREITS